LLTTNWNIASSISPFLFFRTTETLVIRGEMRAGSVSSAIIRWCIPRAWLRCGSSNGEWFLFRTCYEKF